MDKPKTAGQVHFEFENLGYGRFSQMNHADSIREIIKTLSEQLAAVTKRAEDAEMDAKRYRYYVARLFSNTRDWPDSFREAQDKKELTEAIDEAMKNG